MEPSPTRAWSVYLLRCADGTLYAGSTTDVEARARAHNAGRGARYTSGRRPVTVVYVEECGSRSAALRREHALKRLTRTEKEKLIVNARTAWVTGALSICAQGRRAKFTRAQMETSRAGPAPESAARPTTRR